MRWIKFTRSVVVPPNFFTFGSFQWKADISNVLLLKCNGFTLCHGWGTKGCWYDSKFYIHVWVVLHHLEIKYRSSHWLFSLRLLYVCLCRSGLCGSSCLISSFAELLLSLNYFLKGKKVFFTALIPASRGRRLHHVKLPFVSWKCRVTGNNCNWSNPICWSKRS